MPEGTIEAGKAADEGKTGGEGGAPEKEKPVAEKKEAAPAPKPAEKKDETKTSPESKDKKAEARQLADDDEIPEDAELLQMSKAALTKRLTRHSKKELRDHFGTDDIDKIKADLVELGTLRGEKEKRRREEMSEIQRAKEDAEREKARADKAEREKQQALDAQEYAGYDRDAEAVLTPLVAKKHVNRAMRELKEHILTLDDKELTKPKKIFELWAKKFVEENPEFAVKVEEKEPPKKVGLTTGSKPTKPEKGEPNLSQKTALPGKPNSMSRAEYAQYKRERGLS